MSCAGGNRLVVVVPSLVVSSSCARDCVFMTRDMLRIMAQENLICPSRRTKIQKTYTLKTFCSTSETQDVVMCRDHFQPQRRQQSEARHLLPEQFKCSSSESASAFVTRAPLWSLSIQKKGDGLVPPSKTGVCGVWKREPHGPGVVGQQRRC